MKKIFTPGMHWRRRSKLLVLFPISVLLVLIVVIFWRSVPQPASIQILANEAKIPISLRRKFERSLQSLTTNALIWRAQEAAFGQKKTFTIHGSLHVLPSSSLQTVAPTTLLGKKAAYDKSGIQAWFSEGGEIASLREQLLAVEGGELVGHIRLITSEDIKSSTFMGHSVQIKGRMVEVGQSFECVAQDRKGSSGLYLKITLSDLLAGTNNLPDTVTQPEIRTNLHLTANVNLPTHQGLVIAGDHGTNRTTWLVLLHPVQP